MHKLSFLFLLLVIAAGCNTARKTTNNHSTQSTTDSVFIREVVRVDTLHIPADSVVLYVPVDVLKRDTIIRYQSRWASTTVQSQNGRIKINATCDSLQRLVLNYQRELIHKNSQAKDQQQSEKQDCICIIPWYYKAALWLLAAVGLFIVLSLLLKTYLR